MTDRFTRQERLAEIGPAGQARLRAGLAFVPEGTAGALAQDYLERAGVGAISRRPSAEAKVFAHAAAFRHGASRDIGSGAWCALQEALRLLGRSPS